MNIFTNLFVMIKFLEFIFLNLRLLFWDLILLKLFKFLILRIILIILFVLLLKFDLSVIIFKCIIYPILSIKRASLKVFSIILNIVALLLFILLIIEIISIWRADIIINRRDGLSLPSLNIIHAIFGFTILLWGLKSCGSSCWSCLHTSSLFLFVSGCILLRVALIFRDLVNLQIFAAKLSIFLALDDILLIFLKLWVIFEMIEVWVLSVVIGDDSRCGIVQVQAASLARFEVLVILQLLLNAFLFLSNIHLYSYDKIIFKKKARYKGYLIKIERDMINKLKSK